MSQSVYNPFSLIGRRILVTGASSGIGRAIAIECSKMGASLIITGRNDVRLKSTFDALQGDKNQMFVMDLTDNQEIVEMVENIDELNGFVNSAGISSLCPFLYLDRSAFQNILEINLHGPLELVQLLIRRKKMLKNSSIVFISSLAANKATSGIGMYAASKGAVNSMVSVMALELAKKKIRVNSILPGMVRTQLSDTVRLSELDSEKNEKRYPLGYGDPQDVAYAAVFFLSDASKWVTGCKFIIDGGVSLE